MKQALKRVLTVALVGTLLPLLVVTRALAVDIKTVISDSGIKALLVEDYTVPLIALSFAFKGGSAQDDAGKEGTAQLMTNMLDEGAGDITSQAFQEALDDNGMKYSFGASRDEFSGSIQTIADSSDRAFELLRLMLNEPRFDADPIERMKAARANRLRAEETNPGALASKAFREALFDGHPYGRPADGTLDTLAAITAEDLEGYRKRVFARDNLIIGVVGAIDEERLKTVLDEIFGALPETAQLREVPEAKIATGETKHVEFATPQTNIRFVLPGIKRDDPDFYTGYLVNYIFGGGSFSSRLYEEIREKRGLAYGAYAYLGTYDHAGIVAGATATTAANTEKTIGIIKAELKRMAEEGPSEEELKKARDFITGTYAISNLDTSGKIAGVLVAIQSAELGIDYIDKRKDYLAAVTIEDAKRVAKRLYESEPTIITVGPKSEAVQN